MGLLSTVICGVVIYLAIGAVYVKTHPLTAEEIEEHVRREAPDVVREAEMIGNFEGYIFMALAVCWILILPTNIRDLFKNPNI